MPRRIFGWLFAGLLLGYAFLGKGFAYLHLPTETPLFVGELVLAAGILAFARLRFAVLLAGRAITWIFAAFAALGIAYAAAGYQEYGTDAIRDFAVIYYGGFMLLTAAAIKDRATLERVARGFANFAPWYLVSAPVLFALGLFLRNQLPTVPGTEISILSLRPTDVAINSGAVLIFVLAMPAGAGITRHFMATSLVCLAGLAPTLYSRASILSVGLGVACAGALRGGRRLARLALAGGVLLLILMIVNPSVRLPNRDRYLSIGGVVEGVTALLDPASSSGEVRNTLAWRYEWWKEIISDAVDGRYFWTGRGFGENLALTYGIIRDDLDEYALRSPHNVNMTILARMGAPGLGLWVALNAAWLRMVWKVFRRARQERDDLFSGVAVWLMSYWTMAMIISSTDVFLEGPQGGIWFWTVMGVGMGLARIQSSEGRQKVAATSRRASARPSRMPEPAPRDEVPGISTDL